MLLLQSCSSLGARVAASESGTNPMRVSVCRRTPGEIIRLSSATVGSSRSCLPPDRVKSVTVMVNVGSSRVYSLGAVSVTWVMQSPPSADTGTAGSPGGQLHFVQLGLDLRRLRPELHHRVAAVQYRGHQLLLQSVIQHAGGVRRRCQQVKFQL